MSRPPRVLVAEGDGTLRREIAAVLRDDGLEVVETRDGVELLGEVDGALADSLVIVAGTDLPVLGGLDVLGILRCALATTPVILVSTQADPATRGEARELGATAFLDGPVDLEALRRVVGTAAR